MINYAIFHGSGFTPQEDQYKISIANSMPRGFRVNLVSYFKESDLDHLVESKKVKIHSINSPKYLPKKISRKEIIEIERWLGTPLRLIARFVHSYSDPRYNEDIENEKFSRKIEDYVARYVIAWRKFFEKNKIDAYSGYLEPKVIETTSTIVAKRMGIKIANFASGRLSNTFIIYGHDWIPIFWKNLPKNKLKEYSEFFFNRYKKRDRPEADLILKQVGEERPITKTAKNAIREYFLYDDLHKKDSFRYSRAHDRVFRRIIDKKFKKFTSSYLYNKDFDQTKENYFFFPLHFTEESTLTVKERFVDQYNIIKAISWALPVDFKLVVKSHPHWHGTDIAIKKMMDAKKNKNVVVVPHNTNPYPLIKNSKGIVIINSTTGIEAMAFNKPIICFGHDMYNQDGVTITIRDFKDIPDAIFKCINNPKKSFKLDKRRKLLADYYNHLIFLDGKMGVWPEPTKSDCKKIAREIADCIKFKIKKK